MPRAFHPIQIAGLRKIGDVYQPRFTRTHCDRRAGELLESLDGADRIGLHALLWLGAVVPRALFGKLFMCERPDAPTWFYRCFGKIHIQIKAVCALLFYVTNDPRMSKPPLAVDREKKMTTFDLTRIVDEFMAEKSLIDTYAKVLNHQAIRYWESLGYEGLEIADSEPHHLIDRHGTRYLDFVAGYATCHWGRRHPVIEDAVAQAARCSYPNLLQLGAPTLSTILADKLIDRLGGDFERVFFTNSGAETTDYALKMAMNVTGRDKVIYFTGDYHGLTLGALSVNGVTKQQKKFHVDGLHIQLPLNDADALAKAFKSRGTEIAGVILEPVQARGGLVAEPEFLSLARALCDRAGAVLIFDEIKSDFGRTGKDFFYQWHDVVPDILMVAKGLSAGVGAVGALLYNQRVYKKVFHDVEQLGVYSSTFRENNIAMAAGLAVMHLMEHENCNDNVIQAERIIRDRLEGKELSGGDRIEVRGKGLQLSILLEGRRKGVVRHVIDAVEKDMFYMMCAKRLLVDHRIVTMLPNRFGGSIAAIPALNVPLELVEEFCDAIHMVFEEMTSQSTFSLLKQTYEGARQLL